MNPTSKEHIRFLLARRSIRVYSPGDVGDDAIQQLLEAAMAAPSAMTKDPWRFVVVRRPETLRQMAAALPGGKMLPSASLSIVVCGDLETAFEGQLSFLLQDCSASIENLLLAAHALGLGGCWVGVHPHEGSVRQLRQLLGLPGRMVPVAAVALGHPGESLEARTRFNPAYVRYERWGN